MDRLPLDRDQPRSKPGRLERDIRGDGPLYIQNLREEGWRLASNTTVNVTIGTTSDILDSSGRLTTAVNLSYSTAEGHRVTHWVDAGSGSLIATSGPRDPYPVAWFWTVSGEPAFWGLWDEVIQEERFPEAIEVPCCPESRGLLDRGQTATMQMTLINQSTGQPIETTGTDWNPPDNRSGPRYTWNGHHPPDGQAHTNLRLERAVEIARENNQEVASYMEENPRWQILAGGHIENPGNYRIRALEDHKKEGNWIFEMVAPGAPPLGVEVTENEVKDPVRTHEVSTYESEVPSDDWQPQNNVKF